MKNKIKLSVGVPAYNEAENITYLLDSLLSQKQDGFRLVEIIVVSDGSDDGTNELVKRYRKGPVKLVEGKLRLGQQLRQNQILNTFKGDILVIVEADILLANDRVLAELVKPFTEDSPKLGMVFGQGLPIEPEGFYERILYHGLEFKRALFADWREGLNVYTAGGHSMKAMSRQFADKFRWPEHVPEDAYAFFRLKELGLTMVRNPKARAYMRNVTNFNDRKKQVRKFIGGKKALENYFPKDWLEAEYMISPAFVLKHLVNNFRQKPVWTLLFLGELVTNRIAVLRRSAFTALHEIYSSSKKLAVYQHRTEAINRKLSITVGVPAYNEEANIGILLDDLKKQKVTNLKFAKIIVFCDGCTDATEKIVKNYKSNRVKVLKSSQRQGISYGLNQIMRSCNADVLVVLNADIRIKDPHFLEKISTPVVRGEADLTSVSRMEIKAKTFLESVLHVSNKIKRNIFEEYSGGNNVYTCIGQARAFSKRLYRQMLVRSNIGEDAYSYLYCIKNGYRYSFVRETFFYYKSPARLNDHIRQSTRYFNSRRELANYFGGTFLRKQYNLPKRLVLREVFKYSLRYPIQVVSYTVFVLAIKALLFFASDVKDLWDVSASTKHLEVVND